MSKKRRQPAKKSSSLPQVAYSSEEDEAGGYTLTGTEAMLGAAAGPSSSAEDTFFQELPCTLNGINAGLGGGALGFVFGFGECWRQLAFFPQLRCINQQRPTLAPAGSQLIRHRGKGRWKACRREGLSSAKVRQEACCAADLVQAAQTARLKAFGLPLHKLFADICHHERPIRRSQLLHEALAPER